MRALAAIFIFSLSMTAATHAAAQAQCYIPIETYLTDLAGAPASGIVDVEFTFYTGAGASAPAIDCRRDRNVVIREGWLRANIEACQIPTPGPSGCGVMTMNQIFAAGATEGAQLWMGIRIGSDVDELGPRVRIGSVPYAYRAVTALSATNASRAETAGQADNATNATRAASAANADNATNAAFATAAGHAETATTAANATNATNASHAQTATNATNASNATFAVSASSADFATAAGEASVADFASNAAQANTATSAGTAITAGHASTADALTSRRGETYTVWGRSTCATGNRVLYAGNIASITGGAGSGDAFCLANTVPTSGWLPSEVSMLWRSIGAGANTELPGEILGTPTTAPCAVCEGNVYVHWGSSTCASGYTRLYDGRIAGLATAVGDSGGWSPGGPFCIDNITGSIWSSIGDMSISRSVSDTGRPTQRQSGTTISCAVCF